MAQLKRDVQALRGRLEQAGEADALKIHVDEGQVQVLLQVGPRWDHKCLINASPAPNYGGHCHAVPVTSPPASTNLEAMNTSSGYGHGHHVAWRGMSTSLVLVPAPPLLLFVSAHRLAAASIRRSSLHSTAFCLCLQVGSGTKECVVLYLSADDYPNSQMMGMCNNDDELNSKLEGLSEQFEYGASIREVLQQVCHASLSMSRPKPLPTGSPTPREGAQSGSLSAASIKDILQQIRMPALL